MLALFERSVRQLASRDYCPEQIEAWVPGEPDPSFFANWTQRIQSNQPFIIECGAELAEFAGQGLGSKPLRHLIDEAESLGIVRLVAHVSLTAQPLFARHGFVVEQAQGVVRNGVGLPNSLMVRLGER